MVSSCGNISWGSSAGDGEEFGDATAEVESFDPSVWEDLFGFEPFTTTTTTTTITTTAPATALPGTVSLIGGGF